MVCFFIWTGLSGIFIFLNYLINAVLITIKETAVVTCTVIHWFSPFQRISIPSFIRRRRAEELSSKQKTFICSLTLFIFLQLITCWLIDIEEKDATIYLRNAGTPSYHKYGYNPPPHRFSSADVPPVPDFPYPSCPVSLYPASLFPVSSFPLLILPYQHQRKRA